MWGQGKLDQNTSTSPLLTPLTCQLLLAWHVQPLKQLYALQFLGLILNLTMVAGVDGWFNGPLIALLTIRDRKLSPEDYKHDRCCYQEEEKLKKKKKQNQKKTFNLICSHISCNIRLLSDVIGGEKVWLFWLALITHLHN